MFKGYIMGNIFECETSNGKVFKVIVTNKSQLNRFIFIEHSPKSKSSQEQFIRVDEILNVFLILNNLN